MKKKKEKSDKIQTIMAGILVLIIMSALIFYVIYSYSKTDFTIYKEECRNETKDELALNFVLKLDTNYPEININISALKLYNNLDENYQLECLGILCSVYNIINEEVCDKVEVDEIEYCKENSFISGNLKITYEPICIINKKDLTTDWLNSNCECEKGGINDITIPCEDLSCSNRKCSSYKCGDYEVSLQ